MTLRFTDSELDDLKSRHPCDSVAAKWVALRRHGTKFIGPCPLHSKNPTAADSTSFECDAEGWVCAVCCDGGDVIKLTMLREGVDFVAAVELLGGTRALDPAEVARAEAARAQRAAEQEAQHNSWRESERGRAWDLYYKYGMPLYEPGAELGRRYLREARGLAFPEHVRLRFNAAARFYVPDKPKPRLIHTGSALLGAIQRDGKFAGTHSTFIDLEQPKGKARIIDPKTGAVMDAKKIRGSAKGGHVDLTGCSQPHTLIIGEGIEKVLAIWTAMNAAGRDLAHTAFWSAMNLGNLAGKHDGLLRHPLLKTESGRARRVPGPIADMTTPGIVIPESVSEVIILGDSSSDRFTTQCAIARAAQRFGSRIDSPPRLIRVAWSPEDADFDDLLRVAA